MILVSGATGKVGRQLVQQLIERGACVRALTRNPETAGLPGGVELFRGDLEQAEALSRATQGVERVFFMGPDTHLPAQAASLARAAGRSGVRHIVMLSSLSVEMADDNPLAIEHREAEEYVRNSGCTWTLLRGGVFASNTLGWANSIRAEGIVRCVLRNEPYAPIDPYDIACVAAETLTSEGHEAKVYGLTGEESITPEAQTAVLADLLARPIRFIELTESEAIAAFRRIYVDPAEADGKLRALRLSDAPWNAPRPDVRHIINRTPRTYREWAQQHIHAFR